MQCNTYTHSCEFIVQFVTRIGAHEHENVAVVNCIWLIQCSHCSNNLSTICVENCERKNILRAHTHAHGQLLDMLMVFIWLHISLALRFNCKTFVEQISLFKRNSISYGTIANITYTQQIIAIWTCVFFWIFYVYIWNVCVVDIFLQRPSIDRNNACKIKHLIRTFVNTLWCIPMALLWLL